MMKKILLLMMIAALVFSCKTKQPLTSTRALETVNVGAAPNDGTGDPFFNQFEEPVYFKGLPFDLTFLLPETLLTSPEKDITVEINCFNSANVLIDTISEIVDVDSLDGHACSLNISRASIPEGASYFTAEITI